MYGHTLHHGRKRIYSCVQAFSTVEILGSHFNDCFKIKCNGEYVGSKNYERKKKSLFMVYADLESILVSENNLKQRPDESYRNKF